MKIFIFSQIVKNKGFTRKILSKSRKLGMQPKTIINSEHYTKAQA